MLWVQLNQTVSLIIIANMEVLNKFYGHDEALNNIVMLIFLN